MKSILFIEDLTHTSEILNGYNSKFFHYTILIILSLVLFAIGWAVLGKKETVIHATGIIRPIENISFIKSTTTGKIKKINFKSGQQIEQGTELVVFDNEALLKEKTNIKDRLKKINLKLDNISTCIKSINRNLNLVLPSQQVAFKRMQNYFVIKNELTESYNLYLQELNDEKQIPEFISTEHKIKILELNVQRQKNELDKFTNSFLQNLFSEKENYELQKENLDNSLYRVNDALSKSIIYAPISGEIQELNSLNCGDNIFAGQDLLKIIPINNQVQAIIKIPTPKSGLIKENMSVKIKLPAFPHYEFGHIDGKIKTILPDIIFSGNKTNDYIALVNLTKNFVIDKNGNLHNLKVGLDVDASIVTKTDTIISYILKKLEVK